MENKIKPNISQFLLFILLIIIGIVLYVLLFSKEPVENKTPEASSSASMKNKKYDTQPAMTIDKNKKYTVTLQTSKGDIAVELFAQETPIAVNNFVFLARDGFYDGTFFHRIVKGFMIQGGDPQGNGSGGPGYKFADEKVTLEYKRGTLAMANAGPDTNGSQFFIIHKDYDLPKQYTIFGAIDPKDAESLAALDKIAETPVAENGSGEPSKPTETVIIKTLTIEEK